MWGLPKKLVFQAAIMAVLKPVAIKYVLIIVGYQAKRSSSILKPLSGLTITGM